MLPAGLMTSPNLLLYKCQAITVLLKSLDLAANIYSAVMCLCVELPMLEYNYDSQSHLVVTLDITTYLQVVSCLLLTASALSWTFSLIITVLLYSYASSYRQYESSLLYGSHQDVPQTPEHLPKPPTTSIN